MAKSRPLEATLSQKIPVTPLTKRLRRSSVSPLPRRILVKSFMRYLSCAGNRIMFYVYKPNPNELDEYILDLRITIWDLKS